MPLSAWLMLILGALVLYGGLAVCLVIAWRGRRDGVVRGDEPSRDETG